LRCVMCDLKMEQADVQCSADAALLHTQLRHHSRKYKALTSNTAPL
jgi:hypothetical protein